MVGGGIGVTPFSSILKDIVHKVTQNRDAIACKKVGILITVSKRKRKCTDSLEKCTGSLEDL